MEREVPVILDRAAFDAYFGEQAQKLGAVYQLGEKYQTHWALKDGRVRVKTDHFLIDANVIVGADWCIFKSGRTNWCEKPMDPSNSSES